MEHKRLHHVGIILPDEETMKKFMETYGLEIDYQGIVEAYDSKYFFTKMNPEYSDSPVEFLIPMGGVLKEFNGGKGGIHHICYEVDDLEAVCKEFREKGYKLLEDPYVISDKTMKINFVRPRSSFGVLVEFMELIDPEE